MERKEEREEKREVKEEGGANRLSHPIISSIEPLTHEAYGGGMYGKEDDQTPPKDPKEKPASETQSADGPSQTAPVELKHKPPPSSGDRDIDVTGQSYIQ